MPFANYGVLRGTLIDHSRDDPDDQGRWFHVHLRVAASAQTYEVAVDVDSHQSTVGVQWKTVSASDQQLGPAAGAAPGFTALASTPPSGALDHIRHSAIRTFSVSWMPAALRRVIAMNWLRLPIPVVWPRPHIAYRPWTSGDHLAATLALEAVLTTGADVLVWGEPFPDGAPVSHPVEGMHNVHQNQGDPAGSQWWAENGVWQDGAVAVRQPSNDWRLFASKFSSQAFATDVNGHPA